MGVTVVLMFVGAVVGGLAAVSARSDVDRAVDAAVAGLDQVTDDDTDPASREARGGGRAFESAESTLRAWWARPALLVPGVAQQSRAVATMADAGGRVWPVAAATSLEEARPRPSCTPSTAGSTRVDRRRRATSLHPCTTQPRRALTTRLSDVRLPAPPRARGRPARRTWPRRSGGPRDGRDGVGGRRRGARPARRRRSPQRYFLVIQTPSELRGVGGFMGSWGELVIDDGRFDLVRTGAAAGAHRGGRRSRRTPHRRRRSSSWPTGRPGAGAVLGPDRLLARLPHRRPGRSTQLYPQSGGTEVDGVIAARSGWLRGAASKLTGPIDGRGVRRTSSPRRTRSRSSCTTSTSRCPTTTVRRSWRQATEVLFDELTAGDLPAPRAISAAAGTDGRRPPHPAVLDPRPAAAFFESIGADGSVERDARRTGSGWSARTTTATRSTTSCAGSSPTTSTWDPDTGVVDRARSRCGWRTWLRRTGPTPAVIGWGGDVSCRPAAGGRRREPHVRVALRRRSR